MNKPSVTASTIVNLSFIADAGEQALTSATVQWVNGELDLLATKVARDKSGGQVARKHVRAALAAACREHAVTPKKQKGLGLRPKGLEGKNDMQLIEMVLGKSRCASWWSYLSGVARAFEAGVAWTTQSHHTPTERASPASAGSASALADAAVSVRADRKARTVTFAAGAKSAVNADDVRTIIAAITADPARMALTLAYIKSHGWLDAAGDGTK